MDPILTARLEEMSRLLRGVDDELAIAAGEPARIAELGRRRAELAQLVELFDRWTLTETDRTEAEHLALADPAMAPEFRRMAREKEEEAAALEAEIRTLLSPADPNDRKDVILEIRAAAGGDEAAIWAGDLLRMYERYADRHRFRVEPMDSTPSDAGGFAKVTVAVQGRGAFSRFKFEGGVHRVQRVPKTEASGRIHTSTATVAVLPEADDVDVEVDPNDVRVDVYRSQGPGGQSVNTTDSAVRLTHLPTGLVVTCQDEKSQLQNKEKAFRILRARLYQMKLQEQQDALSGARRAQVGTGERSEKIRTYNFKESRVTDHRLGKTIRRLDQVLEGDLDELVEAMSARDEARRLAEG
ncbi:MAG: peptide chain release factor 1 [Actinomycetota bacterium]